MRNSLFAVILGGLLISPVNADADELVRLPAEAKFFVHVNVEAFRKTELGSRMFEMARREAMLELNDKEADIEKIREALGFDPFTELDSLTIVGSNFKRPENHVHLILKLKKTSGNLEGLMAALPGYDSSEYGDHVIHMATPDEDSDEAVYGSIHSDRSGTKRVVAARTETQVKALLDMLDGKMEKSKSVEVSTDAGQFVHVELLDFPAEELGRGPQANVAKMVEGISVKVADKNGDLTISVQLQTREERQAKQVRQMVQGLAAMFQIVKDESDEDLMRAQRFLENLKVKRDGNNVRIEIAVPQKELVEMIEGELEI